MQLLSPGIPPLQAGLTTYSKAFERCFFEAERVNLVVAYVAADSLVELVALIKNHKTLESLNLVVGMAKFDGLTQSQLDGLLSLQDLLEQRNLGTVMIAMAMPVHVKAVVFSNSKNDAVAILGSSNLSGLLEGYRQHELDLLVREELSVEQIAGEITRIIENAALPFREVLGRLTVTENPNLVLDGVPNVSRSPVDDIQVRKTSLTFDLPVKTKPKSNLNVYFGKGRENAQGHVIPRPWYEVELIVDVDITRKPGYPQVGTPSGEFDVITDDGWRFPCQVQGLNSKNFRSSDDLKTLGKWLKERLQNAGVLKIGEPVTDEVLGAYGRNAVTLTKLNEPNLWYIDFSRPNV